MPLVIRVDDEVSCPRFGGGTFRVKEVKATTKELVIVGKDNIPKTVYQADCNMDATQRIASVKRMHAESRARADKVGNPTPRKNR